jgi:hypothetical protein
MVELSRSQARILAVLRAGGVCLETWYPVLNDDSGRRMPYTVLITDVRYLVSLGWVEVAEQRKLGDTFTRRVYRASEVVSADAVDIDPGCMLGWLQAEGISAGRH